MLFFFFCLQAIHGHCSINVETYKAFWNLETKHRIIISLKGIPSPNLEILTHTLSLFFFFLFLIFFLILSLLLFCLPLTGYIYQAF